MDTLTRVGADERLQAEYARAIGMVEEVVGTCPCERGCPSCVVLSRRPDGNRNLSKAGALELIARLQRRGSGNEWQ